MLNISYDIYSSNNITNYNIHSSGFTTWISPFPHYVHFSLIDRSHYIHSSGLPPGYLFLTTCILQHTLIRITSWISLSHYVHFTTYTHQDHSWTLQHCSSGSRPGYKLFIRITSRIQTVHQDQRPGSRYSSITTITSG